MASSTLLLGYCCSAEGEPAWGSAASTETLPLVSLRAGGGPAAAQTPAARRASPLCSRRGAESAAGACCPPAFRPPTRGLCSAPTAAGGFRRPCRPLPPGHGDWLPHRT